MKLSLTNHFICYCMFTIILFTTSNCNGEELKNVGLVELSPDLRARFPICEKQLAVHWINPQQRIGYTEFDTYSLANKKFVDRFKSFVDLGQLPYSYKLVAYYPKNQNDGKQGLIQSRHQGDRNYWFFPPTERLVNDNFDELLALVTKAGIHRDRYNPEQSSSIESLVDEIDSLTLSANQTNVCILSPDQTEAWIVERRSLKYTYTPEKANTVYDRVKELFDQSDLRDHPSAHREYFDSASAYDLNNDGIDDYFFDIMAIYSVKKNDGTVGYQDKYFSKCSTVHVSVAGSQITTNGHEFFLMGCNLSTLVR